MGVFDEIVLDDRTRKLLGKYSGEGVFQTKYWMIAGNYIEVYDYVTVERRICCHVDVRVNLLVKPRPEFACEEPLLRKLKLEEIGVAEKVEAEVFSILYLRDYDSLVKLLSEENFKLEETTEKFDYIELRRKITSFPLMDKAILKIEKITLKNNDTNDAEDMENLLRLLKKRKLLVYLDKAEYGVAVPPGALIQVNWNNLDIYIEETRKRPYKEEVWVKHVEEDPGIEQRVTIEHSYPMRVGVKTVLISDLTDKIERIIDNAVNLESNLLTRILSK